MRGFLKSKALSHYEGYLKTPVEDPLVLPLFQGQESVPFKVLHSPSDSSIPHPSCPLCSLYQSSIATSSIENGSLCYLVLSPPRLRQRIP